MCSRESAGGRSSNGAGRDSRGLPMSTHVSWGSIELLHNCIRTLGHLAEQGQRYPIVEYRAKVKLHGTNCAVQITSDGIVAQSRTQLLTPGDDYKGFATWVHGS